MDEIAAAIGTLRAAVERTADMQTGIVASLADVKAQIHEVKHAQNDAATKVVILQQQTQAHRESDDKIHGRLLDGMADHKKFTQASMEIIQREVVANRELATKRFDDLFAWRNKLYGFGAVIVLGLTVWGHDVYEVARSLFHGK
jgi:hypothetical protein